MAQMTPKELNFHAFFDTLGIIIVGGKQCPATLTQQSLWVVQFSG
jgi:hypothetical protein